MADDDLADWSRRADEQDARREQEMQRAASLEPPLVPPNRTQREIIDARFHGLTGLPDRLGNPRWALEFTEAILRGEYGPRIARAQAHAEWGLALAGRPAAVHILLFVAAGFDPLLTAPDEQPAAPAPDEQPAARARQQTKVVVPTRPAERDHWKAIWLLIKGRVSLGHNTARDNGDWLADTHPEAKCPAPKTLERLISAGRAGLLDDGGTAGRHGKRE